MLLLFLQVVVSLVLLYREVGLAMLPGIGVIGGMLLANKLIAQRTFRCQEGLLHIRDSRVRLVRELLANIKVLKLHAWEATFGKAPRSFRDLEQPAPLHAQLHHNQVPSSPLAQWMSTMIN